jgi:hypothetical protein
MRVWSTTNHLLGPNSRPTALSSASICKVMSDPSAQLQAAVDDEELTRHPGRVRRPEKGDGAGNVFGDAEPFIV